MADYELIITEKPKAALKIAESLADGKVLKKSDGGIPYYDVTHGKKDLIVCSAAGHLYALAEKNKDKWTYPVFDIEWKEASEVSKTAKFSKKYVQLIKKLAKDAKTFTVATDYDVEGEVIGWNIIKYACKQKDAARMKFSTLTKPDIEKAYEHKSKTIDWGQAEAGETRHQLDWYYGINLSRALTGAIKSAGMFKVLSSGRVQGPALKIIVEKEKEIKAFKPSPYWQIELLADAMPGKIDAWHIKDKFLVKKEAEKCFANANGKKAFVKKVERNRFNQEPPAPFDLTSLQTEAYRCHRISPKNTLSIAQSLYIEGYISYPRTSSQKLPKEIGYKKIISDLTKQEAYASSAHKVLQKKDLKPHEGKKSDPAHPAIYPTGIAPKNLEEREARVYDLIVKRFLATFGDIATRETMNITIDINKELFIASGTTTIEPGWHILYGEYATFKEEELPNVKDGQELKVDELKLLEKETQPPKRYTPASIIRELEKRNLGTKATRASIVDTLFNRGYVTGESIEATELGIQAVETLDKYCPKILDEELTRHFEVEMDEIREKKKKGTEVLKEAREVLKIILEEFKRKEKEIGGELRTANKETRRQEKIVGKCPACKIGDLRILVSKKTQKRFLACNRYPDCKTTFSLPQTGAVKPMKNMCPSCGYPMVAILTKGRKPWQLCINSNCPAKEEYRKNKEAGLNSVENIG